MERHSNPRLTPNPLAAEVFQRLAKHNQTVAFAESCTGGLISSELTLLPGVSQVFNGSVVSYANSVKENLLGVKTDSLKSFGAVSPVVATEMAHGAQKVLGATWAISVTGIAGPGGGSEQKPVGLVFFGIAGPEFEETERMQFEGTRAEIQAQTCDHAFKLLLRYLPA